MSFGRPPLGGGVGVPSRVALVLTDPLVQKGAGSRAPRAWPAAPGGWVYAFSPGGLGASPHPDRSAQAARCVSSYIHSETWVKIHQDNIFTIVSTSQTLHFWFHVN